MPRTIGYHWVKSTYGMWLPGDDRSSWSEAWDERIGYYQPHHLHPGDPVRKRMAEERMKHPPVWMSDRMMDVVMQSIGECVEKSAGGFAAVAAAIEPTHIHVLIPYSGRDIHKTVKWVSDQTTKAVHERTGHKTPLWCKGKWCAYVFDESHWFNAVHYIEQHNLRQERGERPFSFLSSAADAIESRRLGLTE